VNGGPLAWLFDLERLGMKFGLENMKALTAALGSPERSFASVHIAGTNGKGSVTAMVAHALRSAGHRTARYTSPHLTRVEERFVIDGREVETERLAAAIARVQAAVESLVATGRLEGPPTFFEATTAAAFELFRAAEVEIAVLETGLGGRLDATNIVTPLASAITTIDYDHQAQLGRTLEEIAAEKGGIIKPGVPVVIGRLPPPARTVIERIGNERGSPLVVAHDEVDLADIRPALPGAHQRDNAVVALALLRTLDRLGVPVPAAAQRSGVEEVSWPGRLELLRHRGSEVLLDAAHNPEGARALAAHLDERGWTGATLVFAAMADKDASAMLAALTPVVGPIICTTPPTPRARPAAALAAVVARAAPGHHVEAVEDPGDAIDHAVSVSAHVVVAGSMFLLGPVRERLHALQSPVS
jgi:dihydrofolate synthase/folylpolyglutamate synthase